VRSSPFGSMRMPSVKRDCERRMREIRTSGVMRGRGGVTCSSLLYCLRG
jgi:hypothetical protein